MTPTQPREGYLVPPTPTHFHELRGYLVELRGYLVTLRTFVGTARRRVTSPWRMQTRSQRCL